MPVSSSFNRQLINVSGSLENHVAVFDPGSNAPNVVTTTAQMQGIDLANYSDNFAKATISLVDTAGTVTTHDVLMLPNSSERYNFAGVFVQGAEIVAVDEPTTPGVVAASALAASATAQAGLVDVNFIEA